MFAFCEVEYKKVDGRMIFGISENKEKAKISLEQLFLATFLAFALKKILAQISD